MATCSQSVLPNWANSIAVVVAHPDDEVLWAGGLILSEPTRRWTVLSLCRASDTDRAPKFRRVLSQLGAAGAMADLDDGPTQSPLSQPHVQDAVLSLWPTSPVDLILTHGPRGEYKRHRRHEEVCRTVAALWRAERVRATELWMFAYEDGGRAYLPRPDADAPIRLTLSDDLWHKKRGLITGVYGFTPDSWEARATPKEEAFWRFTNASSAERFIQERDPRE